MIESLVSFLAPTTWALILMAAVAGIAIEYAARKEGAKAWLSPRNRSPFSVSFSNSYGEISFAEHTMRMPLTVRNSSPTATFDDVEVHLIEVTHRAPRRGTRSINHKLIERSSGSTSFRLLPKMPREVLFLCLVSPMDGRTSSVLKLGPLEKADGEYISLSPGLYKIDIAIYGRNAEPAHEALAVGLDGSGITYGAWRDDLPWPFAEVTPAADPSRLLPQGTPEKTQP